MHKNVLKGYNHNFLCGQGRNLADGEKNIYHTNLDAFFSHFEPQKRVTYS